VTDQGKTLLTGRAQGTDDQGHLLVATSEGIVPILVGDISVRPTPQQGTL
jgi:BirA family biotin operon repressor/biotin-[acetyl-CoA-carboxylase] ligase